MQKTKNLFKSKELSILVLFFLVITLIFNGLAATGALNGIPTGDISDKYSVLFTPAGYVFSIWSLIYLALTAFSVFQILPKQRESADLDPIRILFIISSLLNSLWILAWQYEYLLVSLLIMIGLLITLIKIDSRQTTALKEIKKSHQWLVRAPFSLYLGWISVATIANVSVVLFDLGWNGWGLSDVFWTVLMMSVAVLLSTVKIIKQKDLIFAGVVIWALIGIAVKNPEIQTILDASILGCLVLAGQIVFKLFKKLIS